MVDEVFSMLFCLVYLMNCRKPTNKLIYLKLETCKSQIFLILSCVERTRFLIYSLNIFISQKNQSQEEYLLKIEISPFPMFLRTKTDST